MKNLNEMTLEQKTMELIQSISKAKTDTEYAMQCKLGDGRDEKLNYFMSVANNAKEVINRLSGMDYDQRNLTIKSYSEKLDEALILFPGYEKVEKVEESNGLGR